MTNLPIVIEACKGTKELSTLVIDPPHKYLQPSLDPDPSLNYCPTVGRSENN